MSSSETSNSSSDIEEISDSSESPSDENQSQDEEIQENIEENIEEKEKMRFLKELEYVQLLCNPVYLQFLANNNYFSDPAFIRYLDYLQYWEKPEYIRYIRYPYSIKFLQLLQNPEFRNNLAIDGVIDIITTQCASHYYNYNINRLDKTIPKVNIQSPFAKKKTRKPISMSKVQKKASTDSPSNAPSHKPE